MDGHKSSGARPSRQKLPRCLRTLSGWVRGWRSNNVKFIACSIHGTKDIEVCWWGEWKKKFYLAIFAFEARFCSKRKVKPNNVESFAVFVWSLDIDCIEARMFGKILLGKNFLRGKKQIKLFISGELVKSIWICELFERVIKRIVCLGRKLSASFCGVRRRNIGKWNRDKKR